MALSDLVPQPEYIVAGATHPKVRERQGETYREMLIALAGDSSSGISVVFDDTYRDLGALTELIASADVVVLPYDSADQVTSGVLVDAVAAGRPVISTAFPHGVELLRSGAGIVVPQRDPGALGAALRDHPTSRPAIRRTPTSTAARPCIETASSDPDPAPVGSRRARWVVRRCPTSRVSCDPGA